METQRMLGVRRIVKPYSYTVWVGGKRSRREFKGSDEILSAHVTEFDARAALDEVQRGISNRVREGYAVVHEGAYLRDYYARLSVVPVEVTVAVLAAEELISQS